jgi:hypothetical protein
MAFSIRSIIGRNSKSTAAPAASAGSRPPAWSPATGRGGRPPGSMGGPPAQPSKGSSGPEPARPNPDNPELYAARFRSSDPGYSYRVAEIPGRKFQVDTYKNDELQRSVTTNDFLHDPKSGTIRYTDKSSGKSQVSSSGTTSGHVEHDNRPGGHGFGRGNPKTNLPAPTWASHMSGGTWEMPR